MQNYIKVFTESIDMKIVITGASGFVGKQLLSSLKRSSAEVVTINRTQQNNSSITEITLPQPENMDYKSFPKGDVFIHLGGISDSNKSSNPEHFDLINNRWTVKMAEFAAKSNYSKFIYLSTAKVHGEYFDGPISSDTEFNPNSYYSESKCKAELSLRNVDSNMSIIILRPPAIYGTPLKGGNEKIISALTENKLIPLSSRKNKRSFIGISNVVSAINYCAKQNLNDKGISAFALHEYQTISTNDYILQLAQALNEQPRSLVLPNFILAAIDKIATKSIQKEPLAALHRNFYMECDEFKKRFGWEPLHNTSSGLKMMCEAHRISDQQL